MRICHPSPNPSLEGRGIRIVLAATIFFFLFIFSVPSSAESPAAPITVTAAKIISGDELTLSDNRDLRLEGIKAPLATTQDLADQARTFLEKLVTGKPLMLENTSTDRYDRLTAQVFVAAGNGKRTRIQEQMLRAGFAFVYPPTGYEPGLDALFAAESDARTVKRGLWADDFYADTPATKAWQKTGQFAFVSGTILTARRVKDKVYLNFGEDWRKDFSAAIAAHDLKAFRKAGIDPLAFEGKTVRVRGWVTREGGTEMTLTTPAQIQLLTHP